jgi:hypothetical protein
LLKSFIWRDPKTRLRLMAVALLLICAVSFHRVLLDSLKSRADVLVGNDLWVGSTKRQLVIGLQRIQSYVEKDKKANVIAGSDLALVNFTAANRAVTRLDLVEGTFRKDKIEPGKTWRGLGRHLLLINSVDQDQTLSQGVSVGIGAGCGLQQHGLGKLNLGDVMLHQCKGAYHTKYHVDWVANLAIIISNNADSEKRPCFNSSAPDQDEKYQACVEDAVGQALNHFFEELHRQGIEPDGLVIPALGTGLGHLPKERFYRTLFGQILTQLNSSSFSLPRVVYLQVWAGDKTPWPTTKNALASQLAEAIGNWDAADRKNDYADWPEVLGVTVGLAVLLVGASFAKPLPIVGKDADALGAGSVFSLLIGWFATSLGLATVFKPIVTLLPPRPNPWPQILLGVITTIACGPFLRAIQRFDTSVKQHNSRQDLPALAARVEPGAGGTATPAGAAQGDVASL